MMVIFLIKLIKDGPFTCEKIEISQGASEWSFDCNSVLDKDNKHMTLDLIDEDAFEITVTPPKETDK